MKKSIVFASIALIIVSSTAAFFGNRYYDRHHISSDLKHTLTAAVGPHTGLTEMQAYIHDARRQVRTSRDSIEVAKLQTIIDLMSAQIHDIDEGVKDTSQTLAEGEQQYDFVINIEHQYRMDGISVPADVESLRKERLIEWQKEINQAETDADLNMKRFQNLEKQSSDTTAQLRSDLSMPNTTR